MLVNAGWSREPEMAPETPCEFGKNAATRHGMNPLPKAFLNELVALHNSFV